MTGFFIGMIAGVVLVLLIAAVWCVWAMKFSQAETEVHRWLTEQAQEPDATPPSSTPRKGRNLGF
jgi:uncharacterized membrane protein YqjE